MKNWKYIEGAKVGNYTPNYRYKGFLITNPEGYEFVVFLQDGLHVGYRGTTSKAQAEDWCDWHDPKTGKPVAKFRNSKTGNEAITYTPEQLKRASWTTWQYIISHPEKYDDKTIAEAKRLNAQKTGNDTPWEYAHRKPKVINDDKTGAEEFFKQLSDDVKEREEKDDADIEKVGNAKDKNGKELRVGDIVLVWTSAGERAGKVKAISGDRITVAIRNEGDWSTPGKLADKVSNSKVGNSKLKFTSKTDGKIEYVYDEESQDGFIYDDGKLVDTIKGAGQGWLNLIKQKAFSSGVMNKTGNSASDDKFAYVMREFDEGKLKTPDGKVVTDPAQAKAIAYSESKKTENGLARARKAMNAWNSERKIEPVGKYREFIDNLKNAIELGVAGVLYNSLDEQTVKEWVEKAKKEGYGSHISGVQGKKVILK